MIAENPANPLNLVAGGAYQYVSSFNSSQYYTTGISGAFTSWDGGRSWTQQTLPNSPSWTNTTSPTCNHRHLADTAVAFGPGNKVYYVDLSYPQGNQTTCVSTSSSIGVYVTLSTDGGTTWGIPIGLGGTATGGYVDKPWIAIDPSTGEVYVAYNDDANGTISLRNSTDGGATWGPPVELTTPGASGAGGLGVELAVTPSGDVVATFTGYDSGSGGYGVYSVTSVDRGATFTAPRFISSLTGFGASTAPDGWRAPTLPGLGIEAFAGAPHPGRLYSIWQYGLGGSAGSPVIRIAYSDDNGTSWSTPAQVNTDPTLMAFEPDVVAGADGTVYAEWYGENPTTGHYREYASLSRDGGLSFDPEFAVSDNDSVPTYRAPSPAGWWIGDYTHIIADATGARPFWTDARSPLASSCSPCLWGVDYNISMYTAELVNSTVLANVPVTVNVTGSVPRVGSLNLTGNLTPLDWLVGNSFNLSAPATVTVNATPWYFSLWYGSLISANASLTGTVNGPGRYSLCYVLELGSPCRAPGAPGRLTLTVSPAWANVSIDGVPTSLTAGATSLLLAPTGYVVNGSALGYYPMNRTVTISPGVTTFVNLTLAPIPGTLAGTLDPSTAVLTVDGSVAATTPSGSFSLSLVPATYRVNATEFGYTPYTNASVLVSFGRTTELRISLAPIPGWINGTVSPSSAVVTVNGVPVAVTAGTYSVRRLPGEYWVNATATDYYAASAGPLAMGPFSRLVANVSLAAITGVLFGLIQPYSAIVTVNDTPVSLSNGTFSLAMPPGEYQVNASAPGYDPQSRMARVTPFLGTDVSMSLVVAQGWIVGNVDPVAGSVFVDGRPVTVAANGTFNVSESAGSYELNATLSGYEPYTLQVRVDPGQATPASVVLVPSPPVTVSSTTLVIVAGAVIALAAVAAGLLLLRRRRRPKS